MSNDLFYSGNYQKAAFGEFGLRIIASSGTSTVGENTMQYKQWKIQQ